MTGEQPRILFLHDWSRSSKPMPGAALGRDTVCPLGEALHAAASSATANRKTVF
jgi:hypothetical protein